MSGAAASAVNALIFDLDGTLVDTLDDIAGALNRVLQARGFPAHDRASVRTMIGRGALHLVASALPERAADQAPCVADEFRREYAANLLVRSAPYPGVSALLTAAAGRGVAMSVLSNKPHDATRAIIGALFPSVPFVEVAGQRRDRPLKPDPTVALELAQRMQVAPACCGFVGDSGVDMATARAAGMRGLGVTWGFCGRAELLASGAHALLERPSTLLDALPALAKR